MRFILFFFYKHLDKTALALAIAASLFLLTRGEESKLNAARAVTSFLLYPIDKMDAYFSSIDELSEENRQLREMVATLYHERGRLIQFRDERSRLRKLVGLKEDFFHRLIPCEVIAQSSNRFHHAVTVDRGGGDGVRAGMAVVGYRGVVGRVTRVFENSSQVILLNNKAVSVSCLVSRSRVVGMLEWEKGSLFNLVYIGKEEDVIPGDTLHTSGLGRLFPKGFMVGTVFQVAEEKGGLSRRIRVICSSDLNKLEELFIVAGEVDWEDESIYEEWEKLGIKRQPGGGE